MESQEQTSSLTPKAERTRGHILETALELFITQGYDATTMREIAAAAECSLGLTYRYFRAKEDLAMALYWRMAAETNAQIERLPAASIADRFYHTMTARLEQVAPHRESIGAIFGAAMNPASGVSILGESTADLRGSTYQGFVDLVSGASDAPKAKQAAQIGTILYSLHFGLLLFWLYDRSPGQHLTADLLIFVRDALGMLRRALVVPFVSSALARLVEIITPVFVGDLMPET